MAERISFLLSFVYIQHLYLNRFIQIFFCVLHIIQCKFGCWNKSLTPSTYAITPAFVIPFTTTSTLHPILSVLFNLSHASTSTASTLERKNISLSIVFSYNCCRDFISFMYFILQAESRFSAVVFCRNHALCIIFQIYRITSFSSTLITVPVRISPSSIVF